jgi:hypothetical protein
VVVGWGVAWGSRYDARLFDVGIGIRALGSEKKIALPTPVTCQPYDSLSSSQPGVTLVSSSRISVPTSLPSV